MSAPTPEQLEEARGWVSDCAWKEDPEVLEAYSDDEIVAGVERHYVGGWAEFLRGSGFEEREL